MTNSQYIAILEKALAGMDKQSRTDILLEIKSHAIELGGDDFSLMEQFGAPQELAKQYLDDATIAAPVTGRVSFWGKCLLLWFGAATTLVIAATAILVWYLTQDDFNFADEQSPQLQIESTGWTTNDWSQPIAMNLHQSQTTIYWHSEDQISWKCKGLNPELDLPKGKLDIRNKQCLIFLPRQPASINATQATTIIVRPQANVSLTLEQGSLRIAENGANYRYAIEKDSSAVDVFQSSPSALVTIDINANESTIERYQF
jgi:hypothetical protein